MQDIYFDRSKIYEKLDYQPQPPDYKGKLPWTVQQQIAQTNGIHYTDRVGKLTGYPVYNMPVDAVKQGLMLDIGCGWGRWLVAGANKNYIPVGVDLRLEFCQVARQTLQNNGKKGYTVVADLKQLPFKSDIFDLIWTYSVIQHTHQDRMLNCLKAIDRMLAKDGFTFQEFPNRNGIRNGIVNLKKADAEKDDYNSWAVRYYTIEEYQAFFEKEFGNFEYKNHSFIGIGVLPEDLKYVSLKNKIQVILSLTGSLITKIIPPLTHFSDSIYVKAYKNPQLQVSEEGAKAVTAFYESHRQNPDDNLNLVHLLACPATGGDLVLNETRTAFLSPKAQLSYPIIEQIPVLIPSEASSF